MIVPIRVAGTTKPRLKVSAPHRVEQGSRPTIEAELSVKGPEEVAGKVRFRYAGHQVVKPVTQGSVKLRLKKLRKTTTVKVVYQGNGRSFDRVAKRVTIKVRAK